MNILSFEDWGGKFSIVDGQPVPEGKNSIDWNDIAFIIDAAEAFPPPLPEAEGSQPVIIIANASMTSAIAVVLRFIGISFFLLRRLSQGKIKGRLRITFWERIQH